MSFRFHYASGIGAFMFLGTACSVSDGNLHEESDAAPSATTTVEAPANPGPADASADDDAFCATEAGPARRDQVCHRWRCDGRDAVKVARWTGDSSSCKAGDLDPDASARALRLVNLHRFLADVDPVASEPAWTAAAQQCALVAHANAKLSHDPTRDWRCWSDLAALTSSISLIANRSAPPAIGAFIEDPGNDTTMVHRRWLLSNDLAFVGFGSTDHYSCIVVDGRALDLAAGTAKSRKRASADEASTRGWVAWPPPGPVPMGVFESEHLDEMGWTVQSSDDELDHSTVTVSSDGETLAVRVSHLIPLQGSRSAISFIPNGWTTQAGRTYTVTVKGEKTFTFNVEPTGC